MTVNQKKDVRVVRIGARSGLVLAASSMLGLAMFCWPLLIQPATGAAHSVDAPFAFLLCMPIIVAVTMAAIADGRIDARALAILGVLAGVGAALRPIGAGTGGVELVFFLLILAGRVFGPGFGFVLGAVTLFASALLTAGVGPWLPFQMLAAAWVGCGAGLLPRVRGRGEIALLAAYGVVSAYAFGLLMNLWTWPFIFGAGGEGGLAFVPGAAVMSNLRRFLLSTVVTSTIGWDTGRAITNMLAIVLIGSPVLAVLRRTVRRAAFEADATFDDCSASPAAATVLPPAWPAIDTRTSKVGEVRSKSGADPQP